MIRLLFAPFILVMFLFACSEKKVSVNKFDDPTIVKISDLQDRRNTDSLILFLGNENARYRKEAALAFASVQDSTAVGKISTLLTDADTAVRKAAAFALGQTRCAASETALVNAIAQEKDAAVSTAFLENYGRATRKWKLVGDASNKSQNEGRAWSLYRASLNDAVDPSANQVASSLLNQAENESTRLGAAHYFSRGGKGIDAALQSLARTATSDPSADVRMAAAYALRKIGADSSFIALETILKNEQDYRVKVSAVRAMQAFPYQKTKDYLLRALNDKNVNVGIMASEVIKATISKDFWIDLANRVSEIRNWRIQANIYEAILKVNDNPSILSEIKSLYDKSTNPYQKAALLSAFQGTPSAFDFVSSELFKDTTPVIRLNAAAVIVAMNKSPKFKTTDKSKYADVYAKGIETGDLAMVSMFSSALADESLNYKTAYKDYSFLSTAKSKLSLPRDNEILQSLQAAIDLFENKKEKSPVANTFNHPIDWDLVKKIPRDQVVVIKTTKGNVTLKMLVDEAPGSVANFINLAKNNYFDGKFFHRVVPNFVIQGGCNRGDGLGSEDYSIRSEFSGRRYTTGSVGMASAGKDTEGTQWFITHSPTPHLDGRYTIFAVVTKGMEAVHQIEVGDQILDVDVVQDKEQKH